MAAVGSWRWLTLVPLVLCAGPALAKGPARPALKSDALLVAIQQAATLTTGAAMSSTTAADWRARLRDGRARPEELVDALLATSAFETELGPKLLIGSLVGTSPYYITRSWILQLDRSQGEP